MIPEPSTSGLPTPTTELRLHPIGDSLAIVLLLALVCLVFVVIAYARQRVGLRDRLLLALMRSGLVVLIALLLANPQVHTQSVVSVRRQVALLVDTSASMGMTDAAVNGDGASSSDENSDSAADATDTLPRLQRVKEWLGDRDDGFLQRLVERWDVRCYDFAAECNSAGLMADVSETADDETLQDWPGRLEPKGDASALGRALAQAAQDSLNQPLAAVVLVTDGRHNKGLEPVEAAGQLVDREVAVFAVGLGRLSAKDIEVRTLEGPDVVFKDDKLTLNVTVAQDGFTSENIAVRLQRDGQPVGDGKEPVTVALTQSVCTADFTDMLSEPGTYQYEVSVDLLDGEIDATNNRHMKTVRCIDDALRTLYVEDRPRWEWRFLRDALVRDKRIRHSLETVLISADARASTTEPEYRRAYPSTVEELQRYDLVVFGDVHPGSFTADQLKATIEFVDEHAGGFLMIAGRKHAPHFFKGTPLEELLPVQLHGNAPLEWKGRPFRPVLTVQGSNENALRLVADKESNDARWRRLPDLHWCWSAGEPRPLATTFLVNNGLRNAAGQPTPILVTRPFGAGTSALLATDNTWRWRSVESAKYYDLFWGQMIQWLGLPRLKARRQIADLSVSAERVRVGESVELEARVPISGRVAQSVDVSYQRDNDGAQRLTLGAVADQPGVYKTALTVPQEGTYRVWMTEQSSGRPLSVRFVARPIPTELSSPTMNRALLAAICRHTGGELRNLSTADRILERIPTDKIDYVRTHQHPFWGHVTLLLVMIALAVGEWLYRKKRNLR